ncbi:hypothetical protein HanRHA438_Chr12g0558961 [Helianthus annuus]|nr:hypothetical protein HanRHA438_Chr12g0558961 [Helianthus annuus]
MNKVWDTCPSIMQPFYVFGGKMWDVYVTRTGSELHCSCQLKINVRIQHRKLKDTLRSYRYAICNYLILPHPYLVLAQMVKCHSVQVTKLKTLTPHSNCLSFSCCGFRNLSEMENNHITMFRSLNAHSTNYTIKAKIISMWDKKNEWL